MAYRFLLGGLLALGAFLASATASPLDGAKRVAAQFEAAEEGEIPNISFEDMERNLAKAETELAAYLRTHPDDVDALVLSARLGRIQQLLAPVEWSGGEEPPDTGADLAPLLANLDRAIELEPERAEAHYWRSRLYGITGPIVREGILLYEPVDLDQAVSSGEAAVRLEPKNTEYREALTVFLVNGQHFTEAMEVIRPVKKGRHPFCTLLADFEALPIPEGAIFSTMASESFAEQQVMRGRFQDYAEFRVRVYLAPMTADEIEIFYRKHWENFEFFGPDGNRAQFLKIKKNGLQPAKTQSDFPDSPATAKGILLSVAEIGSPETLKELTARFQMKPIDPATAACFLYTVNYRSVK